MASQAQVMKERDEQKSLEGFIQIDDAYWGSVRKGTKGRGAKGKRPFVAAVALYKSKLFLLRGKSE